MGKLVQVEYASCEWVNSDLEEEVLVLQAGFFDSCAWQVISKTKAPAVLPREATAYEGVSPSNGP